MFLNFTAYNELILTQEDTVYFQTIEEVKKKDNTYRYARLAWTKLSRKLESSIGSSRTRLHMKFAKFKLDDLTINTE